MWHFKTLDDRQKLERRELLDQYGAFSQLSVLIPLAVLQLYYLSSWLHLWWSRRSGDGSIPGSPYQKKKRSSAAADLSSRIRITWRHVLWWTGESVDIWVLKVIKGEAVAATLWTAWLLVLCCLQTQNDYLHLTKRFGIVGSSQLPLQYLLSFKSPYSPIPHLTHCSWETLNTSHQLLGRISTLLFYLHALFYLNFFIQAQVLSKRLKDYDVLLGIIGTLAFTAIGTTALSWIRKLNYRVFFTTHVTLATILLPVLWFHVHHIRIYIVETVVIYLLHLTLRYLAEYKMSATMSIVPGTSNLLKISIPLSSTKTKNQRQLTHWSPGQHVYIGRDKPSPFLRPLLTKNPFTITSLPTDKHLTLVAKIHTGNTSLLLPCPTPSPLILEGPYGLPTHPDHLLSYSKTLFIAGGIGATFTLPIYRSLLKDLSPSPGSRRRQNVGFIWVVKDAADANWAVPDDEVEKRGMQERMTVYVTGGAGDGVGRGDDGDEEEEGDEGIELERLLPAGGGGGGGGGVETSIDGHGWQVRQGGRPDLGRLLDKTFSQATEDDKVAVLVCGPKSMTDEVRKRTGKWIGKRDIWLHVEAFGL